MSIAAGINRLIGIIVDTLRQIPRGRIWLWLLIYFVIDFIVLYAHYDFTSPIFYGVINLWTGLFSDQQATGFTHYPGHFLLLPTFYDWGKLVVGVIFEGLLLGAAALLFYETFVEVDREDRFSFKRLLPSWIHLVLAFVIINAILVGFNLLLPNLLGGWLEYSPRRILFFQWVIMPGVYVIVLALFFYMYSSIAVYRDNIIRALGRSLRLFGRNPITSLVLAAIVLSAPVIFSNIVSSPAKLIRNFSPELVYWLLLIALVAEVIVHFLWMGTSVRVLIDEEE